MSDFPVEEAADYERPNCPRLGLQTVCVCPMVSALGLQPYSNVDMLALSVVLLVMLAMPMCFVLKLMLKVGAHGRNCKIAHSLRALQVKSRFGYAAVQALGWCHDSHACPRL